MTSEIVSFKVDGVEVQGDLYLPADRKAGERRPAIVCGNGFGGLRDMLVTQGEAFSGAGYIALIIDYRSFGRSGGAVRGELHPERQMEDFSAGITYLLTRNDVEHDGIAIWGTSYAGGIVLGVGARDRRACAVISQVPITDSRRWMQWLRNPEQWEELLDAIDEDRLRRFRGEPSKRIPSVAHFSDPGVCAMPTNKDVQKFASMVTAPGGNELTLESMEKILAFNPTAAIRQISPRPLCVIVNTGYEVLHPIDQMMEAYTAAAEPKKLAILPYDQLGFYSGVGQADAAAAALAFLVETLPVGSKVGRAVPRTTYAD